MARKRSGWGGSTFFEFEVKRYKDRDSGKLYTKDQISRIDGGEDSEFEYVTIMLDVEGSAYYIPGYTSGAFEDCYPDDSDSEIESVIGPDKEDWYNKLTSKELNSITSKLIEQVKKNQNDYKSCAADDAYDRWKDDRDNVYDY
jgi:hypothetical protein